MSLSIRGLRPTETATLLDGHPIGPIGAFGGGYNYNVSPFWGISRRRRGLRLGRHRPFRGDHNRRCGELSNINPTQGYHISVTQGAGSNNKLHDGAARNRNARQAWLSQSPRAARARRETFPAASFTQTALLQPASSIHGYQGCGPPPPDLTQANAYKHVNYYQVSGGYCSTTWVGKLVYEFSPKTTLQFTVVCGQRLVQLDRRRRQRL